MFTVLMETIQRESVISFPMLGDLALNPPSYFTVFGKNIYFYGVLIALGFILGIAYCSHNSSKYGIKEDDFYDIILWLLPTCIIGARLYFVLFRLEEYLAQPERIFAVWEGGLAIYGGIIAGALVIFFICRKKKLSFPAVIDLLVFGLLIGQSIGRWGNFMNREAFGAETEIFCRMGLTAPDGTTIFVHPTFLYESLWNISLFVFLVIWTKKGKRKYDGQVSLIYFLWYGIGRAWIEGLRTDSLYIGSTGIRVSQLLSVVLAITALIALIIMSRKPHPQEKLFVNRADGVSDIEKSEVTNAEETIIQEENKNGKL